MKVSIIIPIFNKIEVVEECIRLNIKHSENKNEWIIIDNNSNDATKQGIQRLKVFAENHRHTFIIIEEKENTGVAKAWNKGMLYANQPYVCILNNDCVMMPGWDSLLVKDSSILDIFSPLILEDNMFNKKNYSLKEFMSGKRDWNFFVKTNKNKCREGIFGGVVFFGKSSAFKVAGQFDERFWVSLEDIDFLLRAKKNGLKIGITGNVAAYHFVGMTRKIVHSDGGIANQKYFEEKWGWRFEKAEKSFPNKQIKSYQKFMMKYFYKLASINLVLPK